MTSPEQDNSKQAEIVEKEQIEDLYTLTSEKLKQKLKLIQDFQSLLFSSESEQGLITSFIEQHQTDLSLKEFDHQLVLAFSLNYEKFPVLAPLLSKPKIQPKDFLHFDQKLILLLLQANISFPIQFFKSSLGTVLKAELLLTNQSSSKKKSSKQKSSKKKSPETKYIEKDLYEELSKKGLLSEFEDVSIREKTNLEEAIENDNLELFRSLILDDNYNQTIKKENFHFQYSEIPILSYCIEVKAVKCFKQALINGADPSKKSLLLTKEIWDSYGFAGAIGNTSIIKMIENSGFKINKDLVEGCVAFHQNHIFSWLLKEYNNNNNNNNINNNNIFEFAVQNSIQYENYEVFDQLVQNKIDMNYEKEKHLSSKKNSDILIFSGLNIAIQKPGILTPLLLSQLNIKQWNQPNLICYYYSDFCNESLHKELFSFYLGSPKRIPLSENDIIKIKSELPVKDDVIQRLNQYGTSKIHDISNTVDGYYQTPFIHFSDSGLCFGETVSSVFTTCPEDLDEFFESYKFPKHFIIDMFESNDKIHLPNFLIIENHNIRLVNFKAFKKAYKMLNEFNQYGAYIKDKDRDYIDIDNDGIIGYIIGDNVYFKGENIGKISDVLMKYEYYPEKDYNDENINNDENKDPLILYAFSDIIAEEYKGKSVISGTLIPMIPWNENHNLHQSEFILVVQEFGFDIGYRQNHSDEYFDQNSVTGSNEMKRVSKLLRLEKERFLFDREITKLNSDLNTPTVKNNWLKATLDNTFNHLLKFKKKYLDDMIYIAIHYFNNDDYQKYLSDNQEENFNLIIHQFEDEISSFKAQIMEQLQGKTLEEQNEILEKEAKKYIDIQYSYYISHIYAPYDSDNKLYADIAKEFEELIKLIN